jgi:hypothetical protein
MEYFSTCIPHCIEYEKAFVSSYYHIIMID